MSTPTDPTSDRPRPPWSQRYPARAAAAYALAYLVIALAGAALAPAVKSPLALALLATAVGIITLALSLLLVLSICRLPLRPASEFAWMLGLTLVFALARPSVFAILGRWLGFAAAGSRLADLLSIVPGQQLVGNAALILWAIFVGRLVSRVIREGKLILPVAVVASIADIITVFWGLVAQVSEKAPEVVDTFSASAPVEVPPEVPAPVLTAVGIGDFLFVALFVSIAIRYTMNASAAVWATFIAMLIAPLAFIIWPDLPGLPGLPFISLAVLAVNWRYLEFAPSEKRALAFAAALVAAIAIGIWVLLTR